MILCRKWHILLFRLYYLPQIRTARRSFPVLDGGPLGALGGKSMVLECSCKPKTKQRAFRCTKAVPKSQLKLSNFYTRKRNGQSLSLRADGGWVTLLCMLHIDETELMAIRNAYFSNVYEANPSVTRHRVSRRLPPRIARIRFRFMLRKTAFKSGNFIAPVTLEPAKHPTGNWCFARAASQQGCYAGDHIRDGSLLGAPLKALIA